MKAKKLFAVLLAAVSLFTFCACGGTTDEGKLPDGKQDEVTDNLPEENPPVENPPEETPPEVETPPEETLSEAESNEIKEAYAKLHKVDAKDVSFTCYGKFDGTYVLMISGPDEGVSAAYSSLTVDGITFLFRDGAKFNVYRAGKFYKMQEAFDLGFLSNDNLYSVWEKHRAENDSRYSRSPVEYVPLEWEIKTAFVTLHANDRYPIEESDVSLRCYGEFHPVYVLFVDVEGWEYSDAIHRETVSGIEFIYSSSHTLTVYSKWTFYSLSEAYENGLLSHDELLKTQKDYRARHEYLYH